MNTIHDVVKNESPTDVILFLTRGTGISHPHIDRLYTQNNWIHLGDCMALIELTRKMTSDGLIEQKAGGYVKGPKWSAPKFMLENKYTFNQS
ncbi:hypothetical protein A3L25_010805 [Pseudomonas putida]|uniref:Uncharacterized protein n=1 Tax=Pseudomonas putida TaxID=303 RepID=A0AAP9MZ82_PSEPU|nr:hypothetical protein [Pseudomonas putida]MBH3418407.1 hypothetical protein [Pseudomonas putida]MDG9815303.1 hypothetical protein [Pseudomonas putida]QJQ09886.1 hypothetical protein A3L25_010805 [Pseudomonas putida]